MGAQVPFKQLHQLLLYALVMIHSLLDQLEAPGSDDEDDPSADLGFSFRVTDSGGKSPSPEQCRALVVCAADAATAFVTSAFSLELAPWALDVRGDSSPSLLKPPRPPRFLVSNGVAPVAFAVLDGPVADELATPWVEALLSGFGS